MDKPVRIRIQEQNKQINLIPAFQIGFCTGTYVLWYITDILYILFMSKFIFLWGQSLTRIRSDETHQAGPLVRWDKFLLLLAFLSQLSWDLKWSEKTCLNKEFRYDLTKIPSTNKAERNRTIWLLIPTAHEKKCTAGLTRIPGQI